MPSKSSASVSRIFDNTSRLYELCPQNAWQIQHGHSAVVRMGSDVRLWPTWMIYRDNSFRRVMYSHNRHEWIPTLVIVAWSRNW